MKKRLLIFILWFAVLLSLSFKAVAQQLYYPLNQSFTIRLDKHFNADVTQFHSGLKPYLQSDCQSYFDSDSLLFVAHRYKTLQKPENKKWLWRKLRYEDFLFVEGKNYKLMVNPLFYMQMSLTTQSDSSFTTNTRGIEFKGNLTEKVSFYTAFYENQAFFPAYIDNYVNEHIVVPGQGARKTFKTNGHDYSRAVGYVSVTPVSFFNIQLGHSKHFVGEGYRSLLLSDNSFNYPFSKFTVTFPKWQYTGLYTAFLQFSGKYYSYHQRKHGTFHLLSLNPAKNFQIGLFEGIIWQTSDSTKVNDFPVSFFNPVMFIRPLQYSLDNENNVYLGLQLKYKVFDGVQVYGQFLLDQWGDSPKSFDSRYGYQVGLKYFGSTNAKSPLYGLFVQGEYNMVRPYTYSHSTVLQSITHFNQPLAHPLGAGFSEAVGIVRYQWKDLITGLRYSHAKTSADTLHSHFGSDVFLPESMANFSDQTTKIGGGIEAIINHLHGSFAYIINPRTNLHLFIGYHHRRYESDLQNHTTQYLFLGIRTGLNNYYFDF